MEYIDLKVKNGYTLVHEAETQTYWLIAPFGKIFAGGNAAKAERTFNHYTSKKGI